MQAHVNPVMSHDVSHKGVQGGLRRILYKSGTLLASFAETEASPWAGYCLSYVCENVERSGAVEAVIKRLIVYRYGRLRKGSQWG